MKYCMKEYVRNLSTRLSAKLDENPFDNFSVSEKKLQFVDYIPE